jgi:hypothetical protein
MQYDCFLRLPTMPARATNPFEALAVNVIRLYQVENSVGYIARYVNKVEWCVHFFISMIEKVKKTEQRYRLQLMQLIPLPNG